MYDKNISLGISLNLDYSDYEEIFKKYHKNIKEVYSSTSLPIKELHSRYIIVKETNMPENNEKLIKIIKLAKSYNIKFELAINSRLDLDKNIIEKVYNWCKDNDIQVDKIVTLHTLVDECYKYFGDIEYCYSYNNNIKDDIFLENLNPLFTEIVLGNRSLRNINLMKKIKDKGLQIKLLLDNGCSHNCLWCSSLMSNYCNKIFYSNTKKYSKEFLVAIQTIFPYEVPMYYEELGIIDSYKLSTRSTDKYYLLGTLEHYIEVKNIISKEQIPFTGKLKALVDFTNKNDIDLYKIHRIKDKIWSDALNGR